MPMPGQSLMEFFVKFMMVFIPAVFVISEVTNMASPLAKFASHSTIDEALGDGVVAMESDKAFYTLKGEDKNKNGIRDDVERVIDYQYSYKNGKIDYYDNPRDHDFYEDKIRFLMKKMQSLTQYEDTANWERPFPSKNTRLERKNMKGRVMYLQGRHNIRVFSKCLYDELNAQESVGTGAEYLQILRTQLNNNKRRKYFGESMLLHGNNIFESFISHKPRFDDHTYDLSNYSSELKFKPILLNRKDCSLKEFN
jgi:hypothetical protein